MEPRPWVGETLKTEKKAARPAKMTIYRDEVSRELVFNSPFQIQIFTPTGLIGGMAQLACDICVISHNQMHIINHKSNKYLALATNTA